MHVRARVARTMMATLLCTFLAALTLSQAALAQSRGNSGLPAKPGNPIKNLQQQIDALKQQIAPLTSIGTQVGTLQQQVATLQKQMTALQALQQQINTLSTQMTALQGLQQQINTLSAQMTALQGLQQQINTLNAQIAGLNKQVVGLTSQVAVLGTSSSPGVFDASGKKIGDVVGVQDSIPWVGLAAAGQVFALQVSPNQLLGGFLWYSGSNCSGSMYISYFAAFVNGPNVLSVAAVHEPDGVVYAAAAGAPQQVTMVRSVLLHDGSCYDYGSSFNQNLVPAAPVMTMYADFKRPFSVR
jgi:hypothetical protein